MPGPMTPLLFTDLAWLPRPPADFGSRCRAALADSGNVGTRLCELASCALDGNQLLRLAKALDTARSAGCSLQPLAPFRLAVLGNGTLDVVAAAVAASAVRYGIALEAITVEYGQIMQAALAADSRVSRARPDAVLVAVDYRAFPLRATPGDMEAAQDAVPTWLRNLTRIAERIRTNTGAVCIFQARAPPPEGLFGHSDRRLPGTLRSQIDAINRGIVEQVIGFADVLLDVAALAETVGLAEWHSPAQWNMAKLPFADAFVPLYAEHVARVIGALRGKSRKCLVLDLDNTLWGGVIGDDGLEGIHIAQGDPVGEAFLSVQGLALALRQRGIVLAVASKNNDETARTAFREHPEMLLREDHIAVFQANWTDKASNIKPIADALSFGLDALVFLDDNTMDRDLVRARIWNWLPDRLVQNDKPTQPDDARRWRLPRRDYVILPLLCLFTALCMLGITEAASRIAFAQHEKDACMVYDPVLGTRFKPNCVSHVKSAEGPWVTNSYNACGFRTPQPCGLKPPGGVRIAVLGSSIAQGYLVPYRDTFSALASAALEKRCDRPVDFQNLASIGCIWQRLALRAHQALALQPNAAVIVVVPFDLQQSEPKSAGVAHPMTIQPGPMKRLESLLRDSRAVVAAQHFMFGRPNMYVPLYLRYGDRADFLRPPFSKLWQERLMNYDHLLAGIAAEYHAAHVPLLLVFVPQRAQAALLAEHRAPPGIDPYAFGQRIGEIAAKQGIDYLDLSPVFAGTPNAAALYYPVDGHLAASGFAVVAQQLVPTLLPDVPALASCAPPNVAAAAQR